jgi:undecaprenyl-diphosphatase
MLEALNNFDTQLFYLINGHHCGGMDWVMWFLSSRWSWLIVLVTAYLFVAIKYDKKCWWLPLAAIGLCFLLADRGSVLIFKDTVCRLRPCHALENVHMFREGCGGQYGFVSSHAANAFALLTFFWLRYRKKVKEEKTLSNLLILFMAVWAVAMCYSRVYLGKHYPGDILCGAIFGVLVGWIVYWGSKMVEKKFKIM